MRPVHLQREVTIFLPRRNDAELYSKMFDIHDWPRMIVRVNGCFLLLMLPAHLCWLITLAKKSQSFTETKNMWSAE